jgi:hypothetical protein
MAKRLAVPSKEAQLVIVGPTNYFKASRIQRLSLSGENPSTNIDEIGSASHAGEAKDVPSVTLSFSAFDVGVKIFSVLTGTDWAAYPAEGVDIGLLSEIDAIIYVKSPDVSDMVKSAHARRLQVRDFSYSYSVDGEATEDYTAVGSARRWFAYDVVVDRFTTAGTGKTLTQTPVQLKSGNYLLSVIVDGAYLKEVSSAPEAGEYSVSGTTLTLGVASVSTTLVVYHANPEGNNWSDVADPDMPAAVRGKDIYISIAANSIARVQSVTLNGNMNTQEVPEMGNPDKIVGYQKQVPTVEGTLTVLDTDNELMSLFQYGVTASGIEWNLGEGCTSVTTDLTIELRDPCDETIVLKTIFLDEISPTTDAFSVNVNNNAQMQIGFRSTTGHLVVFSGAKA